MTIVKKKQEKARKKQNCLRTQQKVCTFASQFRSKGIANANLEKLIAHGSLEEKLRPEGLEPEKLPRSLSDRNNRLFRLVVIDLGF